MLNGLALELLDMCPWRGGLRLRLSELGTEGGGFIAGGRGACEEATLGLHPVGAVAGEDLDNARVAPKAEAGLGQCQSRRRGGSG